MLAGKLTIWCPHQKNKTSARISIPGFLFNTDVFANDETVLEPLKKNPFVVVVHEHIFLISLFVWLLFYLRFFYITPLWAISLCYVREKRRK